MSTVDGNRHAGAVSFRLFDDVGISANVASAKGIQETEDRIEQLYRVQVRRDDARRELKARIEVRADKCAVLVEWQ